jgi:beta-lactamase superfamily II metal-dependent hydrolase
MTEPASAPPSTYHRYLIPLALLGLVLFAAAWFARPDGQFHVYFFDTPGDAILIQTEQGKYTLIDGGSDPALLSLHLGRTLPFWRRSLDAVILTRSDPQRLTGQVAALTRYRTDRAIAPADFDVDCASDDIDRTRVQNLQCEWLGLLSEQQAQVRVAQAGDQLRLDSALVTVLTTGAEDEAGLVLRLDYGATSVILDGAGVETDDDRLLAAAQPVTVLAYPWQRDLATPLVNAWQPQAIIFTQAWEAEEPILLTWQERRLHGAAIYHNKLNGTIEIISDGRQAWIETEK